MDQQPTSFTPDNIDAFEVGDGVEINGEWFVITRIDREAGRCFVKPTTGLNADEPRTMWERLAPSDN